MSLISADREGEPRAACQVPDCKSSLADETFKNVRLRICSAHEKAATVDIDGEASRFCQQCAKFHPLEEFSGNNRGCKKRLEKHNERRKLKTKNKRIVREMEKVMNHVIDVKQHKGNASFGMLSRELAELEPAEIVECLLGSGPTILHSRSGGVCQDGTPSDDLATAAPHAPSSASFSQPCTPNYANCGSEAWPVRKLRRLETSSWASSPADSQVGETVPAGWGWASSRSSSPTGHLAPDEIIDMGMAGMLGSTPDYPHGWDIAAAHEAEYCGYQPYPEAPDNRNGAQHCVMDLKIVGITPGGLPEDLREEITSWLQVNPSDIHGSIRPGCVHLTLDMWFDTPEQRNTAVRSLPTGFARSVASGTARFPWCRHRTQLLVENTRVVAEGGRIIECQEAPVLPLVLAGGTVAPVNGTVQLITSAESARNASVLCRAGGLFHDVSIEAREEQPDGSALLTVRLPASLGLDSAWFQLCDLASGRLTMSRSVPLLVLDTTTVGQLRAVPASLAACMRATALAFAAAQAAQQKASSQKKRRRIAGINQSTLLGGAQDRIQPKMEIAAAPFCGPVSIGVW